MKTVLVYGSRGALGRRAVASFAAKGWRVIGVATAATEGAAASVTVPRTAPAKAQLETTVQQLKAMGAAHLDAVVCTAGGWAGGAANSAELLDSYEQMRAQCIEPPLVCTSLFATMGAENSLLVLTGSAASLKPTPGMLTYGAAKAATHHIVRSAGADAAAIPKGAAVVGVCPMTLDTEANRSGMPNADFSGWTPCEAVTDMIVQWADHPAQRPASGALVEFVTKGGATTTVSH
jgi:dihydropteridine reductase